MDISFRKLAALKDIFEEEKQKDRVDILGAQLFHEASELYRSNRTIFKYNAYYRIFPVNTASGRLKFSGIGLNKVTRITPPDLNPTLDDALYGYVHMRCVEVAGNWNDKGEKGTLSVNPLDNRNDSHINGLASLQWLIGNLHDSKEFDVHDGEVLRGDRQGEIGYRVLFNVSPRRYMFNYV